MLPPLTRLPRAPTTSNIDATSTTSTTSSNNTSFTIATTSTVFNRTAQPLVGLGAHFAASPYVVVFSIVGYPSDVRSVLLHPTSGALAALRPSGVLVHMTTSEPSLAAKIAAEAEAKGCHSVDVPRLRRRPRCEERNPGDFHRRGRIHSEESGTLVFSDGESELHGREWEGAIREPLC